MRRLEDMSLEELWEVFPIILSKPNPEWINWANEEMEFLKINLQDMISVINHIGSTAIPGIIAKPIIDILLETNNVLNLMSIKNRLLNRGYLCMNETASRIDLNKGYTVNGFEERVFHLHVRLCGDNDEIYFRDYLNKHNNVAKDYENLKLSLWKKFEHDRDGYTKAKMDFITRYTDIAKQSLCNV